MKKFLSIFAISMCAALLLSSCAPSESENISSETEAVTTAPEVRPPRPQKINSGSYTTKNLDGISLSSVDFTDCIIHYYYRGLMGDVLIGIVPEKTAEEFIQCLVEAEISQEIDYNYEMLYGGSSDRFRITLNTKEVIYIGYDGPFNNPDDILINGEPHKCDKETLSKLEDWIAETPADWEKYV